LGGRDALMRDGWGTKVDHGDDAIERAFVEK
jgi:hypothetical protein